MDRDSQERPGCGYSVGAVARLDAARCGGERAADPHRSRGPGAYAFRVGYRDFADTAADKEGEAASDRRAVVRLLSELCSAC